ncbi:MAG: hypothetical protein WBO06_10315 [Gammaproteobacteria bacterium]
MPTSNDNVVAASELDIPSMRLGLDKLEFQLETRADVRTTACTLAGQAQKELLLHTEDLEPDIYDQQPFLDAVSNLARQHRDARFWILIQDGRRAVQEQHRLIELARRLSSHVQFRRPAPNYHNYHKTFLLADTTGYLYRPLASRFEGIADFNCPGEVAPLRNYFMEVWEHSEPDEEMRRLYL